MKHSVVLAVGQSQWVCKDCPFTSRSDYDASKHARENSGVEKPSPNAHTEPKQTYCRWCRLSITMCPSGQLTSHKYIGCKGWIHDGGAHGCLPRVAELDVELEQLSNRPHEELLEEFADSYATWTDAPNRQIEEAAGATYSKLHDLILGKMGESERRQEILRAKENIILDLQSKLESAERLIQGKNNSILFLRAKLKGAFWASCEETTRPVAYPVVLDTLKWALDYIADGSDYVSGYIPQHACEYTSAPQKGHCGFHEKFFSAARILRNAKT